MIVFEIEGVSTHRSPDTLVKYFELSFSWAPSSSQPHWNSRIYIYHSILYEITLTNVTRKRGIANVFCLSVCRSHFATFPLFALTPTADVDCSLTLHGRLWSVWFLTPLLKQKPCCLRETARWYGSLRYVTLLAYLLGNPHKCNRHCVPFGNYYNHDVHYSPNSLFVYFTSNYLFR